MARSLAFERGVEARRQWLSRDANPYGTKVLRQDWDDGWMTKGEACKQHPRYQAKRKPRVLCEACWSLWFQKNGLLYV